MTSTDHDPSKAEGDHGVVVAGGGPTGLMLAAELTLAGTDVVVVERRASQALDGSRAGGLHTRTIEILDQRGVADRFLSEGTRHPALSFATIPMDLSDFPTRHNYLLALWQRDIERILADWVLGELAVPVLRSREVVGFIQDETGVDVGLSDGASLRAEYLVGCDGGRSVVRKLAGIDFRGIDPSTSWMIAEVEMAEQPVVGLHPEGGGIGPVNPAESGGPFRVVIKERQIERDDPTFEDLRAALTVAYGTDFGSHSPTWISRFTDMARQAATYRAGRVLLAGDAAHVHPPQGGQGLNIGVQDAVNLGWKLAQVVAGTSPDRLLDTYQDERHPVGARVVRNTMAQVVLGNTDERHLALRDAMSELLAMDEPRRAYAGMISGLDVHYDLGGEHPLVGRRMPDLDVLTADGPTRAYDLLHEGRPVLIDLSGSHDADVDLDLDLGHDLDVDPSGRVRRVDATYDGRWDLPVIGEVDAPAAVLIRPDGYVAWAGSPSDPELRPAMAKWFGTVT